MRGWLSSFRVRVTLTYLAIFVASAAIMAARAGSGFARTTLDNAEHDLGAQAIVMAAALLRPSGGAEGERRDPLAGPQLQALTGQFAANAGSQLTILDPSGNPIATSLDTAPANQGNQPEVAAALAGRLEYATRVDPLTGKKTIYTAVPMAIEEHTLGVMQAAVPMDEVTAQIERFWLSLGLTALLAAALATTAGWWLAGQLVRPVGRLRDAAARLAAGNLEERVPRAGAAEMAQLAGAFNDMAERIEASISAQRAFVANASHELRTPLTNIKLRAEALADGALDDPAVASRFVQEIGSEADRLGRLATDLLTLSRQDAAPPPTREAVSLPALIPTVAGAMELRAEKAGVALAYDVAPGLPTLSADPAQLRAVLENLIDNALHYTPPGGSITIRARASGPRPGVVLEVEDSGCGIAAEDVPHIFGRFYRADKARGRATGVAGSGAGLGLAIVKGIVEAHGGTVAARSTVGQGTTISINLPAGAVDES